MELLVAHIKAGTFENIASVVLTAAFESLPQCQPKAGLQRNAGLVDLGHRWKLAGGQYKVMRATWGVFDTAFIVMRFLSLLMVDVGDGADFCGGLRWKFGHSKTNYVALGVGVWHKTGPILK
jgi:hypothetical protein